MNEAQVIEAQDQNGPRYGRLLDNLSISSLYLIVVSIPLVVAPFQHDQVMGAKVFAFQVLVSVALAAWLIKGMLEGFTIRWTPAYAPLLVFLGLAVTSTVFSISPYTSIFGRHMRYEGLIDIFLYGGLFFLTVQHLSSKERLLKLMALLSGTAALVSIYAIFQFFGWDPIAWGSAGFETSRAFATLGNPIILGGYLAVALTVSAGLSILAKNARGTAVWSAVSLLIAAALLFTLSRGAWLGAVLGVPAVLVLLGLRAEYRRKCLAAGGALVVFLFLGVILIVATGKATTLGARILSLGNPLEGSGGSRVEIWKSAVSMIQDRPVLGYGPDTFRMAFPEHETFPSAKLFPEALADNAHNLPLQTAATLGIPALLALAAIFGIASFQAARGGVVGLAHVALAAGAAFFAQSLLNVSVIGISYWPWLLFGAAIAPRATDRVFRLGSIARRALAVPAIFVLALIVIASSAFFYADIRFAQGILAFGEGDASSGIEKLSSAAAANPFSDLYARQLAYSTYGMAREHDDRELYEKALDLMDVALKKEPNELDNYIASGELYLYGGDTYDRRLLNRAAEQLEKAVATRRHSPAANRILGLAYLRLGKARQAVVFEDTALAVTPKDARATFYKGQALEALGETDRAASLYEAAVELRPDYKEAAAALDKVREQ
ncbi:MAG: O-antigen ligase family protein [Candidatus Aquicultorales bacterium]